MCILYPRRRRGFQPPGHVRPCPAMSARDPLQPLRRDVDLLATTLGTTLAEQEGPELLEAVEHVRLLARAARESGGEAEREALRRAIGEIDGTRGRWSSARSPSTSCSRTSPSSTTASGGCALRAGDGRPRPETLDAAFAAIRAAGIGEDELRRAGGRRPARAGADGASDRGRAAHVPAEPAAARPSCWTPSTTRARPPAERADVERALAEETTMLWQTDEVRSFRPTVVDDEVRQGLWFFESSLFGAGRELARRWQQELPGLPRRRCASAPGSAATRTATRTRPPAELLDALARARTLALRIYRDEVRELARAAGRLRHPGRRRRGAAGLDRPRRGGAAMGFREETRRAQRHRALPAQADGHLAAAGQRARRPRRAALRPRAELLADLRPDRPLACGRHAGGRIADGRLADLLARVEHLRAARGPARRARARRPGAQPDERPARDAGGGARRAGAARHGRRSTP